MIAEIGRGLLWLAGACVGLAAVAGLLPRARLSGLAVPAAVLSAWLWLWIAAALAWLFVHDDMSVAAVAGNSHSHLPANLKLAAIVLRDGGGWLAGAAGSTLAAAAVALLAGRRIAAVGAVAALSLGLHLGLLIAADPFARLDPAPTEGVGFPSVWRDRLAALAPPGTVVADAVLPLGGSVAAGPDRLRFAALTPDAGPDSTQVLAELRLVAPSGASVVLIPQWRETNLPLHAAPVADSVLAWGGWYAATLGPPGPDGRWPVRVTRLDWRPLAGIAVALAAGGVLLAWRRRR